MQVTDSQVPYLQQLLSTSATQEYPGVTSFGQSAIFDTSTLSTVGELLGSGYANATTPLSLIIVDYIPTGAKSNSDTAFGWRGKNLAYIWAFWQRTPAGAEADGDALHVQVGAGGPIPGLWGGGGQG